MSQPPRICLIGIGHAASSPRLVKNADALAEVGYAVHVVSGRSFPPVDALDAKIFDSARWAHTRVDYTRGIGPFYRKLMRTAARKILSMTSHVGLGLAVRAVNAEALHFGSVAARTRSSLYLGHGLAGLPAAASAARACRALYGFDAEDFHDAETEDALLNQGDRRGRVIIQSGLLPGCAHLTAAAPLIAKQYERAYGVRPLTLLNVFPLSEAPQARIHPEPISIQRPARFYWFSQTIGPGRGLEKAIGVLGRMRTPVELHLRGFSSPEYAASLAAAAERAGLKRPIQFLDAAPSNEMARLASTMDMGLSIEEPVTVNRDVCLTNKVFVYLLAGIPQVLSITAAQAAIAPELGESALLLDMAQAQQTASTLDEYFSSPDRIAQSRQTAWNLAQQRYCWDIEKQILLRSVERALKSG